MENQTTQIKEKPVFGVFDSIKDKNLLKNIDLSNININSSLISNATYDEIINIIMKKVSNQNFEENSSQSNNKDSKNSFECSMNEFLDKFKINFETFIKKQANDFIEIVSDASETIKSKLDIKDFITLLKIFIHMTTEKDGNLSLNNSSIISFLKNNSILSSKYERNIITVSNISKNYLFNIF